METAATYTTSPTQAPARLFEPELKQLLATDPAYQCRTLFTAAYSFEGWTLKITPEGQERPGFVLGSQRKAQRTFKTLDALHRFIVRLNAPQTSYRVFTG